MKTNKLSRALPVLTILPGLAAMGLRAALYAFATDEKGLLIPRHPLEILLWILTAGTAAFLVFQAWLHRGSRKFAANFPASTAAAVGCGCFAAGILVTVLLNRHAQFNDEFARNIAGLLAVPSLTAVAICRHRGKRPVFVFHSVVCLFLVLYTISRYPDWSSLPQLQDSFFCLMSCVLLLLFGYHQTAFDVGMGSRRRTLGYGLLAVFVCLAAVPHSPDPLLFLTGAVWAATNLCSLKSPVRTEDAETN